MAQRPTSSSFPTGSVRWRDPVRGTAPPAMPPTTPPGIPAIAAPIIWPPPTPINRPPPPTSCPPCHS